MQLEATDLLAINRGGVNYKITAGDLRNTVGTQPTDSLMVQRGDALYKVTLAEIRASFAVFEENDFLLVQRGDELLSLEASGATALLPYLELTISTVGIDFSDPAFVFSWSGCRAPDGFTPQIQFPDSNPTTNPTYFLSASGKKTWTPGDFGGFNTFTVRILGQFDHFEFKDSTGLVTVETSGPGAFAAIVPTPDEFFGDGLFGRAPKLTTVPLDVPWRSMFATFSGCTVFNQDIGSFNVTGVEDFWSVFLNCTSFNQDISSWDVSSATQMRFAFKGCSSFNKNLNATWGPLLTNVYTFADMFESASSYNQPMNLWDVSGATDLNSMFYNATIFNRDLSGWCVPKIPGLPFQFADNSALDPSNYPVWGTCP
jgi:surface protein